MDDLVTWLRAQLDADEAKAKAATRGPWRVVNVDDRTRQATVDGPDAMQDGGYDHATGGRRQEMRPLVVIPQDVDYGPTVELVDAEHIARHDPVRVLAEVDAKRRIIDEYEADGGDADAAPPMWDGIVKLLALPYADRPGYRDEWKP